MMDLFVSYAQNLEDVMLWRALKHIQRGFYVDVGAMDPKEDSVTYAFYERGWRGINIEPMNKFYEELRRERTEDINLPYAVGAAEGKQIFYEVAETGISSVIPDSVFNNKFLAGREVIARKIPLTTLNKIFQEHVRGEIHFLKIDVEGYEKNVLQGLDLKTWRPWILVVEATLPNSSVINPDFPDAIISSADYTLIYFDGLNRFYIAKEKSELSEAFSTPPNVFDYYSLYAQEKANAEIASLRSTLDSQEVVITNLNVEVARVRAAQEHLILESALSNKEIERLHAEVSASRAETESIQREYSNILYSRSYRITKPLRVIYTWVHKIRTRARTILHRQASDQQRSPISVRGSLLHAAEQSEDELFFQNFIQHEVRKRKLLQKDN